MALLSKVEQAYLSGTRDFTKSQQRYMRYRLRKKLRLLNEELARTVSIESTSLSCPWRSSKPRRFKW